MTTITKAQSQGLSTPSISATTARAAVGTGDFSGNRAAPAGQASITQAVTNSISMSKNRAQFPGDRGKYYMTLWISSFSIRQSLTQVGSLDRHTQIILPLPANIFDFHQEQWVEEEYGMVAGVVSNLVNTGSIAGAATTAAASVLAGSAAQNLVNKGGNLFGKAANAFQTVLYRGPKFKSHQLKFKLAPRNPQESESIRYIIYLLNNAASPMLRYKGALFDFPDIVEAAYWPNSSWLHKFKPSVLQGIEVNYQGGGQKAFYGGSTAPESVELTLHMLELEYWTKGDFKNNTENNPYDGYHKGE